MQRGEAVIAEVGARSRLQHRAQAQPEVASSVRRVADLAIGEVVGRLDLAARRARAGDQTIAGIERQHEGPAKVDPRPGADARPHVHGIGPRERDTRRVARIAAVQGDVGVAEERGVEADLSGGKWQAHLRANHEITRARRICRSGLEPGAVLEARAQPQVSQPAAAGVGGWIPVRGRARQGNEIRLIPVGGRRG